MSLSSSSLWNIGKYLLESGKASHLLLDDEIKVLKRLVENPVLFDKVFVQCESLAYVELGHCSDSASDTETPSPPDPILCVSRIRESFYSQVLDSIFNPSLHAESIPCTETLDENHLEDLYYTLEHDAELLPQVVKDLDNEIDLADDVIGSKSIRSLVCFYYRITDLIL